MSIKDIDFEVYIQSMRQVFKRIFSGVIGVSGRGMDRGYPKVVSSNIASFSLAGVLQNKTWKELFDRCPSEVVQKRCMIAVCQAHGGNPAELLHNKYLDYLSANNADPLFCAHLLRLGDLLDFDDTRAPRILYSYVVCNNKSRAEWDKHQASAGFRYPASPFMGNLPYKARCTNPGVEHAVRDFLDWIDEELTSVLYR